MDPKYLKQTFSVIALCLMPFLARAGMPEIVLTAGGHRLTAEVAYTDADRAQGLMHRRMLPENRGMLFVFPGVAVQAMWMMNTYIPLSVAFLDQNGVIINIADMAPHTRDTHASARPAKYALEANLGWFRKHGIKPGARIEGLERAPAPK